MHTLLSVHFLSDCSGLGADCSGLFISICSPMGRPGKNVRKMDAKTLDTFYLAQQSVNILNPLTWPWFGNNRCKAKPPASGSESCRVLLVFVLIELE